MGSNPTASASGARQWRHRDEKSLPIQLRVRFRLSGVCDRCYPYQAMNFINQLLKTLRCLFKGHRFLASRTEADVDVCVRCRMRRSSRGAAGESLAAALRELVPPKD